MGSAQIHSHGRFLSFSFSLTDQVAWTTRQLREKKGEEDHWGVLCTCVSFWYEILSESAPYESSALLCFALSSCSPSAFVYTPAIRRSTHLYSLGSTQVLGGRGWHGVPWWKPPIEETLVWFRVHGLRSVPRSIKAEIGDLVYNRDRSRASNDMDPPGLWSSAFADVP